MGREKDRSHRNENEQYIVAAYTRSALSNLQVKNVVLEMQAERASYNHVELLRKLSIKISLWINFAHAHPPQHAPAPDGRFVL